VSHPVATPRKVERFPEPTDSTDSVAQEASPSRSRRRHTSQRAARWLTVLLTFPLLLGLCAISTSRLVASIYAGYAQSLLEGEAARLPRARSALDVAVRFWPLDAEYHNQRGQLAVTARDLATAEAAYFQSLRLRPTWPYTWANAAQYQLSRGLNDERFMDFWQQGLALGPAEDHLHLTYSQIGLTNWYRLTRQQRHLLHQSLDYLIRAPNARNSFRDLTLFARRQRLQSLLCRLGDGAELEDWCARYNPSRRASNR